MSIGDKVVYNWIEEGHLCRVVATILRISGNWFLIGVDAQKVWVIRAQISQN